jgi:hypothetical protein
MWRNGETKISPVLGLVKIMSSFKWMQDEKEQAENNSCPVHLKPCVARKR